MWVARGMLRSNVLAQYYTYASRSHLTGIGNCEKTSEVITYGHIGLRRIPNHDHLFVIPFLRIDHCLGVILLKVVEAVFEDFSGWLGRPPVPGARPRN